jgi:type II secretory pathway component PulJ
MTENRFARVGHSQRFSECVALFRGAEMANRIAHSSSGNAQRDAYRVKTNILLALVELFPDIVEVFADPVKPWLVSVRIAQTRYRIHAMATDFPLMPKKRYAA